LQVYRLVTDKSNRPPTTRPRASLPLAVTELKPGLRPERARILDEE
jgi:hypothetical protein